MPVKRCAVAVTGLGLVTPAGVGPEENWATLCAGISTARTDPALAGLPVDFSCHLPDFDARAVLGRRALRMDRFSQLAVCAARQAVADAELDPASWNGARVGVVLGVASTSMESAHNEYAKLLGGTRPVSPLALPRSLPNMAPGEVCVDLGALGPVLAVSTACASGATAIGTAKALLTAGMCDIVIAGGSESPRLSPMIAACFSRMTILSRRVQDPAGASRPFDTGRDGFVLGEGAGVLVLESAEHARARSAPVRAYLAGYGLSADAHHATAPHPDGEGLRLAVEAALEDAGMRPSDIGHINAHGTATRANDAVEGLAMHRVFDGSAPPVTATKSIVGHAFGGAGAMEAAFSILALQHQTVPPTANLDCPDPGIDLDVVAKTPRSVSMDAVLSNSLGFGGQNAALVLAAP